MTGTDTLARIRQACNDLHTAGHAITFTKIASRTGLSRTTLYRNPAARDLIEQHRNRKTVTLAEDIAALRTAIEAIAAKVRRQEEEIRRLRNQT